MALDMTAYAAPIATQLGAHISKVKLLTAHIGLDEDQKVYEEQHIQGDMLTERLQHVLQSTFNGRRIVIFSGGTKAYDATIIDKVRAITASVWFGLSIGCNSFL